MMGCVGLKSGRLGDGYKYPIPQWCVFRPFAFLSPQNICFVSEKYCLPTGQTNTPPYHKIYNNTKA